MIWLCHVNQSQERSSGTCISRSGTRTTNGKEAKGKGGAGEGSKARQGKPTISVHFRLREEKPTCKHALMTKEEEESMFNVVQYEIETTADLRVVVKSESIIPHLALVDMVRSEEELSVEVGLIDRVQVYNLDVLEPGLHKVLEQLASCPWSAFVQHRQRT